MHDTTMLDIYEAAGGMVNEDRTQVSVAAGSMTPFEITLRVVLSGFEVDEDGQRVTLGVVLDDDWTIDPGPGGGMARFIRYDESLVLPVKQVRIKKD